MKSIKEAKAFRKEKKQKVKFTNVEIMIRCQASLCPSLGTTTYEPQGTRPGVDYNSD